MRLATEDVCNEGIAVRRAKCGEVEERTEDARGKERAAARAANTILKEAQLSEVRKVEVQDIDRR